MDELDRQEAGLRRLRSFIDIGLAHVRLARAARDAAASFDRFGLAWELSEIASVDLGEFDNRAHDWLRSA